MSGKDLGDAAKPCRCGAAIAGVTPGDDGAIVLQGRKGIVITPFPVAPPRPAWPIDCYHHPLRRDRGGGRLLAGGDQVAGYCCCGRQDLGNDRFTRIHHAVGQRRQGKLGGGTACREADRAAGGTAVVAAGLGGAQQPIAHRERGRGGAGAREAENRRAAIGFVAVGDGGYGNLGDYTDGNNSAGGRIACHIGDKSAELIAAIGQVALGCAGIRPAAAVIRADLIGNSAAAFLAAQTEGEITIIGDPIGG